MRSYRLFRRSAVKFILEYLVKYCTTAVIAFGADELKFILLSWNSFFSSGMILLLYYDTSTRITDARITASRRSGNLRLLAHHLVSTVADGSARILGQSAREQMLSFLYHTTTAVKKNSSARAYTCLCEQRHKDEQISSPTAVVKTIRKMTAVLVNDLRQNPAVKFLFVSPGRKMLTTNSTSARGRLSIGGSMNVFFVIAMLPRRWRRVRLCI